MLKDLLSLLYSLRQPFQKCVHACICHLCQWYISVYNLYYNLCFFPLTSVQARFSPEAELMLEVVANKSGVILSSTDKDVARRALLPRLGRWAAGTNEPIISKLESALSGAPPLVSLHGDVQQLVSFIGSETNELQQLCTVHTSAMCQK